MDILLFNALFAIKNRISKSNSTNHLLKLWLNINWKTKILKNKYKSSSKTRRSTNIFAINTVTKKLNSTATKNKYLCALNAFQITFLTVI